MTKGVVTATFSTGGVGVVETALGPNVLQSLGQRCDEDDDNDNSLDQTRGMFDLSSQVSPDHPVHGDNAPYALDRSKAA